MISNKNDHNSNTGNSKNEEVDVMQALLSLKSGNNKL